MRKEQTSSFEGLKHNIDQSDSVIPTATNLDNEYILLMENITKVFLNGKIIANDDITIGFKKGKIHAIIGENGSGKSTLMSILFGLYKQEKGTIFLEGKPKNMYSSGAAKKYKIGMVHQHFHLIDTFTVLENILLGQEEDFMKGVVIDWSLAKTHFEKISSLYDFGLDPDKKVSKLNVGQKQKVEIMKVLWKEKNIIIFDEPTATLSVKEIEELLNIIKLLKKQEKTIIFISHKLQEVKEISDEISILNKGKLQGTFENTKDLSKKDIANLMFSNIDSVQLDNSKRKVNENNKVLEVKNLSYITSSGFKALNEVSFDVKEGEIFGLAGIEGNGQEEIVKCIVGIKKMSGGEIILNGEVINKHSIAKRNKTISYIPIDRAKYGMVSEKSIEFNSIISDLDNPYFGRLKFKVRNNNKNIIMNKSKIKEHTKEIIKLMQVDGADDIEYPIRNLSGGNQQKFVIGRELSKKRNLIVAGHPTRGLDIKAINNIYQKMIDVTKHSTILLYSLEINELMNVCDRIAVLYKGKIVDIINPENESIQSISRLMIGERND